MPVGLRKALGRFIARPSPAWRLARRHHQGVRRACRHPADVIDSLLADRALSRVTDLAVQVHSIDPPHDWIPRSIELVAQEVAPALGWRPRRDNPQRAEAEATHDRSDIIDTLAGLAPGSRLVMIRDRKP